MAVLLLTALGGSAVADGAGWQWLVVADGAGWQRIRVARVSVSL